jgi:sec-independent protein translocase protein TatB
MLRAMFGMGGTEILVILIVALLFLGPDKLPEAAKSISKGIRDIKKQSRVLQRTIEEDEHIGGAIRDLKSALRGEDEPIRPRPRRQLESPSLDLSDSGPEVAGVIGAAAAPEAATDAATDAAADAGAGATPGATTDQPALDAGSAGPSLTLPPTAGESDGPASTASGDAELAALVKPVAGTIAHSPRPQTPPPGDEPEPKHG